MPHYLDPKNDLTFKRVFGEHKHLCMSLINSMLPLPSPVVDIEYQSNELIPELADVLRHTIVDVSCVDSNGRQFIVEMQMYWSKSFKNRVLLNASKAYVKQLDKTKEFTLLKPVYALSFVNDTFENSEEYYHYYKIVNINDTEKQIEGLEFLFVELPKFKPQNRAEKKLRDLWLRFLTEINENTTEIPQELQDNKFVSEAVEYMNRGAYTKAQLNTYDKWKIDAMTEYSMINDALRKGEAMGMAEGLEKGIAEGLEKGKIQEKLEIAKNAKALGLSKEQIQQLTNLSIEEIENI
ncbi:MAG: Rpn family recombination-promoting nuclease/putative transposase [Bacteroidales bacterium]|jgi:predicted transposase/invertase (TIGR01784 family)|nr:Rpn family recombination-promoting nuclease/putative transposase [Bacteroidales bacterium]